MSTERKVDFGRLLKRYRRTARLTQAGLAEQAGYSPNYISMLERGVRLPALTTIDILAEALHLSPIDRNRLETAAQVETATPAEAANASLKIGRLIGRDREMARIVGLIAEGVRLLTLTGPGGVGKTRLAEQIAGDLRSEFPDGSLFVDLAAVGEPEEVITAVGQSLKIREEAGGLLREELVEHLRLKKMLLLLDSMEHVLDAAPWIADLLNQCPNLIFIVTSRTPLRLQAEQEFPVPPLVFPSSIQMQDRDHLHEFPAIALFVQRARLVQPDFPSDLHTLRIVADICRHLDGLPLAIELAAARVKHLPLTVLDTRLENRLQVLTGGARDLPERHQRMWDTIAWSYDLLKPAEQGVFQQLSSFVGTWSLEAAEGVCQLENAGCAMQDVLRALVDSSLVTFSEPRYGMLDTIREFAAQQLASTGQVAAVRRRHADYFLHFAEQAGEGLQTEKQSQWFQALEMDHDNLRAALKWLLENDMIEPALRLAISVWRFWMLHGDFREGRRWLEEGLSRSSKVRADVRTKALWGAYWLAYHQGDYARSAELSARSLDLSDRTGDALDRRNALTGLGIAALAQGRYSEAVAPLQESVQICRRIGKPWHLATSLLNMSFARMYLDDYPQTLSLLEEALEIYHELGDKVFMAKTQNALGFAALHRRELDRAETLFLETLRKFSTLGEKTVIAESLEGLAAVFAMTDRSEKAVHIAAAAGTVRETNASQTPPFFRVTLQQCLKLTQDQLSPADWTMAWNEGCKMTAEQAIAYALMGS